jgi:DNA-binding MarR family transcriptional regulator
MLMNTLERPTSRITLVKRAPAEAMDGKDEGRTGPARSDADRFVARLLAAAEESVASTSYAASRRRILRRLEVRGPLTLVGLSQGWPVTPRHLAQLVYELEQDGLVEGDDGADGPTRVRLTADGRAALAATRAFQLDLITKLLQATAKEDATLADATWRRLRAALDG